MRFAPQRRALFRHLNFQKCSETQVFCTFSLGNVLRATTACNFSSLIWPAGSAPAALESLLFDPPEPQIIGKTQCFATFLPFCASASSFFWLFLFYCKGLCTSSKVSKTWGFCSISKNDGRHGAFEEDLQRCIFRGRRSTKDMFMRDVRRSGRWFPEKGCILEYQMCRFAKMILRDRCSTSYDLASIFRGRRSTLDRWTGKIAKRIGTRLSALHSTFHFWRKSRRILSFLMSWTSKNEEVSQNSFVSDVVKFKKWRCLAELFRFGRCYVQTLRKSRRISSFLILQIDR